MASDLLFQEPTPRPLSPLSGGIPDILEQTSSPPRTFKHKKSIKIVAAEHIRRVNCLSSVETSSNTAPGLPKTGAKLWGGKLEEAPSGPPNSVCLVSDSTESSPDGVSTSTFRWVRGELLGKGTYSKIYLALNSTTGEIITTKQVEISRVASGTDNTPAIDALKWESEILKDLDHPNIVQYLGFEETPTLLSMFLEYIPGGSIGSCLRKFGKFDEEVTKSFTGQILDGLDYLHSNELIHHDLKPDIILVDVTGTCKISDFAHCRRGDNISITEALTQEAAFYTPPEVIQSKQFDYRSKVDIWSVGCIIFEMWFGQQLWNEHECTTAILIQLGTTMQGPPVPGNVSLTSLAEDFRQKCFASNPDARPSAFELRRHPYLELSPGWAFNGFH